MPEAEIRTQRLVIVDARGRDRVVVEAGPGHASVLVRAPAADGRGTTGVELYVVDPIEPDGAEVGLALIVHGDVVGGVRRLL